MTKQIVNVYTFDPVAKTITLPEFDSISLGNLALITNVTRGVVMFNFADPNPALGATVSGNVITLTASTQGMAATDQIRIDYTTKVGDPAYDRQIVGNARSKFRDGFASVGTQPDPGTWTIVNPDGHQITQGGNSSGSSYLRISLNPLNDGTEVSIVSKQAFRMPMRTGFGITASQRVNGQEFFVGMVEADTTASPNMVVKANLPADKAITANIVIATNVGTITVPNHGFTGGDRVHIYNCPSSPMNVAPVVVTVVDQNTFTVPIVASNGTYNATGGMVGLADPLGGANNGVGFLFESTGATTTSHVLRRNGARFRTQAVTTATTTATQANTNPFTDAFNTAANWEQYLTLDEVLFRSFASDSTAAMNSAQKYTQGIPDENPQYRIQARVKTLPGQTRPVARITNIAKSGTTTATVTTDLPHGLTVDDWVSVWGVRDQVNFANQTTWVQVASVPTSTTFTVVLGSAVTASSAGGSVWRVQGNTQVNASAFSQVVQSISRTAGVMTVVGNANWATPLPGETVYLHGLDGAGQQYEGMYRVLKVNTTSLLLDAAGPDFASINCGGTVIRVTDVRLHFARVMDYTRHVTEVTGGRGVSDSNNAVPVYVSGSNTVGVSQSTGTATTQWNAAGWGGYLVADVASAALTATTTTAAIAPGVVNNVGVYAHSFNVVVTAATGTTPTLDVGVEESIDNGTNWVRIYDFPRIRTTGSWTSPLIRAQFGTRYRYVQTVTGTSPSFTRAINRVQFSSNGPLFRRYMDRSIVLTTLNSVTPTYIVEGAERFMLAISLGAGGTTFPVLQLEGSEDGGTTWFAIGAGLTGVASSVVRQTYSGEMPAMVRARVSTAGVGVTADYVLIKAIGA